MIRRLTRSGLVLAVLLSICAGALPAGVRADTDLTIGGTARIAYANGDPVRLHSYPGQDAPVIDSISEGTAVTVLDGPTDAGDGTLWYHVSVGDQSGYVIESFLVNQLPADTSADTTDQSTASDSAAPADATGPVYAIAGTNGEGARCRVAPSGDAQVIVVLPEGTVLQIAGDAAEGWQPVTCENQAGFVATQFVAVDSVLPVAPTPTEEVVTEEPTQPVGDVTEEPAAPTDEATETPTEQPTEVVTEEPTDAPTDVVTEEPTDAPTEAVTDAPTDESAQPTDEATDAPTDEATTDASEPATEQPTETADATETATPEATATGEATETATPDATKGDETATATESATTTPKPTKTAESDATATAAPTMGTPVLSGTAIVLGTNGSGVRCRATASDDGDVVTVLPDGEVVQTNGDAVDGWQPVICDSQAGFVRSDFLLLDRLGATSSGSDSDVAASVKTAMVSGTNGDGLRCRASASSSGAIITVIKEGATLKLRSGSKGQWQAVTCAGQQGFVSNTYLSYGGVASQAVVSAASTNSKATGTATVAGTNGDGLRCRADNSFSASVLMVLKEGATVSLRGAAKNGWQPVYCGSTAGYVSADYLANVSSSATGSSSGSSSSGSAVVTGTGGTGVRLRSAASTSASVITVVPEGATVKLRSGSTGNWTAVSYQGSNGFIYKDYLTKTTSSSGSSSGSSSAGSTGLKSGQRAKTTANLNLRYSASSSAGIAAVAPQGTVVLITGSLKNNYYPVDWDGLDGYMSADYLLHTKLPLSSRGGSSDGGGSSSGGSSSGGSAGGSATGSAIVDYAMQYLGYPYVWATHGPSSFDCSGFTYWVVLNVLGRDIGAGLWTQVDAGTSVSQSNLQPGDLIFFQNTYTWGLSHVGIYIGNGQFIHAENETTGVVISNLSSTYYSTRWYGAVRLT